MKWIHAALEQSEYKQAWPEIEHDSLVPFLSASNCYLTQTPRPDSEKNQIRIHFEVLLVVLFK